LTHSHGTATITEKKNPPKYCQEKRIYRLSSGYLRPFIEVTNNKIADFIAEALILLQNMGFNDM